MKPYCLGLWIFAVFISFAGGMEYANTRHEAAAATAGQAEEQMLATMNARSAVQAQQIAALNKLALVWQQKANQCEEKWKPAGQFFQGALDTLQGGRR